MTTFFALLLLYVVVLVLISWRAARGDTEASYLIANRDRPWWQIMASKYAATVGAGWFIAYVGFAYSFGISVGLVFVGAIIGVVLYALWAVPRILAVSGGRAYTQTDFVFLCTKSKVAREFLNGGISIGMVLALLIAVVGSAALLETYDMMSYELAVLFTMVVVVGYILLSGYKAVLLTDVVQALLLFVLIGFVTVGLVLAEPISVEALVASRGLGVVGALVLGVFGFASLFADPTRYQVTFAGRSVKAVRTGLLATGAPLIFSGLGMYLIGTIVYQLDPTLASAAVFPIALTEYVPDLLVPYGFFVFFVAIMSTADSYMYALASHVTQTIRREGLNRLWLRGVILVVAVLITGLALLLRDVVAVAILSGAVFLVVAAPMLYLIGGGRSGDRFVLLLAGGFVGAFFGVLFWGVVPAAGVFVLGGQTAAALLPASRLLRLLA